MVRPAGGQRAGAHGVFQRQIPADNPGKDLAECGVRVGVSAARQRNHGRELRIAQRGEGTTHAGEHEREHQAGPCVVRAQARQHENSRANHRANAQGRQLKRSESALQTVLAGFSSLLHQRTDRLPGEEGVVAVLRGFAGKGGCQIVRPARHEAPHKGAPAAPCIVLVYTALFAGEERRDQSRYTGTPHNTITKPGQAVWVLYSNSTNMMASAATIYSSGTKG